MDPGLAPLLLYRGRINDEVDFVEREWNQGMRK